MKKMIAMILALLMCLSLAACGGSKTETAEEPAKDNAADTAETAAPAESGDVIELTYWHSMDGTPGEIVEKQIAAFNDTVGAEKGIHVTGVFQNWPGTEALNAAMPGDDVANMPDVIQLYSESVDLIRSWDRTAWAEDFINAEGNSVTKSDLVDNMVSAYSLDGKMIGVPYAISTLVLYYNQDLLAQAGYDNPPKTIAEMADMISAIKEKTDADYGLNVRINEYEFENFIATQGTDGTYFGNNESGRTGNMTEITCQTEIQNFLNEWAKVIATGGYKATKDSMSEEFAQGLNAMALMTCSKIPEVAELVGDSFKWNVAAAPVVADGDVGGGYPSGSGLFMINRDDDARLQATWEFVQFMISPEAQAMWLDGYCYVPVNKNTADNEAYQTAVAADSRLSVPYEILANEPASVVASFCPNSSEVDGVIKNAMLSFADGTTDAEATYNEIISGIDAAFESYFRANPID